MFEKIIEYRTVSSPNIAKRAVEYFKEKYKTDYDWGLSNGEVDDAIAVCVLELDDGNRYVTTTTTMRYIEGRKVEVKVILGEL